MSVLALVFSWIWWVTFLVNIVGFVMFQLPWCCRQRPADIYASVGIAMLNMAMMIGLGIYVFVVWSKLELV